MLSAGAADPSKHPLGTRAAAPSNLCIIRWAAVPSKHSLALGQQTLAIPVSRTRAAVPNSSLYLALGQPADPSILSLCWYSIYGDCQSQEVWPAPATGIYCPPSLGVL